LTNIQLAQTEVLAMRVAGLTFYNLFVYACDWSITVIKLVEWYPYGPKYRNVTLQFVAVFQNTQIVDIWDT
jgi:hypothetical protein